MIQLELFPEFGGVSISWPVIPDYEDLVCDFGPLLASRYYIEQYEYENCLVPTV